ncbi:hypothetical protein ACWEKM_21830 [Streptomyces sp. NPDC004752]
MSPSRAEFRSHPDRPLFGLVADPDRPEGEAGRTLLLVRRFDTPFLLTASLSTGAGSSELTLDRGTSGKGRIAEFRRLSGRAVLVLRDKHRLTTAGPAAVRAGADSFARSVIWSAPVLREDTDGALIDPTGLAPCGPPPRGRPHPDRIPHRPRRRPPRPAAPSTARRTPVTADSTQPLTR